MIDRGLNYGRDVVARFLREAGPFDRVLDLGAGTGQDLESARRLAPGAGRFAVEWHSPTAEALRAAGVQVHRLDIERARLPFEDEYIDVVIANQILEHVKEVFWVLHEVSRVLRVGGHMIVGVPNLAALHNRVLLAFGRQPSPIKTGSAHVRGFTRRDLVAFLDACFPGGYALTRAAGSNFYPLPPPLAKPMARLFPSLAWGMFLLFEKRAPYAGGFLEFPQRERLESRFHLG